MSQDQKAKSRPKKFRLIDLEKAHRLSKSYEDLRKVNDEILTSAPREKVLGDQKKPTSPKTTKPSFLLSQPHTSIQDRELDFPITLFKNHPNPHP